MRFANSLAVPNKSLVIINKRRDMLLILIQTFGPDFWIVHLWWKTGHIWLLYLSCKTRISGYKLWESPLLGHDFYVCGIAGPSKTTNQ